MALGLPLSQNFALAARIGRASIPAIMATSMAAATTMTGVAATF